MDFFELLVNIQYSLLFIVFLLALFGTYYLDKYKKIKQYRIKKLEKLFIELSLTKIDSIEILIKEKWMNVRYILPAMDNVDQLMSDSYWDYLKSVIVHVYLPGQLNQLSKSFYWYDHLLAVRILQKAPNDEYIDFIIKSLSHKEAIVRYEAVRAAVELAKRDLVLIILDKMKKSHIQLKYVFRDPLVQSNEFIHEIIKEVYLHSTDISLKTACLEVLSLKATYLKIEDLEKNLEEKDENLKWWTIRAMENCPCEKTAQLLSKIIEEDIPWHFLCLSIYVISSMHLKSEEDTIKKLTHHTHHWVRYVAMLTLMNFSLENKAYLEKYLELEDEEKQLTAKYVLQLDTTDYMLELQKFFPINQEPKQIINALG